MSYTPYSVSIVLLFFIAVNDYNIMLVHAEVQLKYHVQYKSESKQRCECRSFSFCDYNFFEGHSDWKKSFKTDANTTFQSNIGIMYLVHRNLVRWYTDMESNFLRLKKACIYHIKNLLVWLNNMKHIFVFSASAMVSAGKHVVPDLQRATTVHSQMNSSRLDKASSVSRYVDVCM